MHEIGHALGYRSFDGWPATEGCAMNVPSGDTPLARTACIHERQMAFWKYGDRDSVAVDVPLITGVDLASITLDPGDTIWLRADYLLTGSTAPELVTTEEPAIRPWNPPAWLIEDSLTIARIVGRDGDSIRVAAIA